MSKTLIGARQKYWSELNNDEKLERIREEVKRFNSRLTDHIRNERDMFGHSHKQDGAIVVPYRTGSIGATGFGSLTSTDLNKIYF